MCSDTLPFIALRLALMFLTPHSTIPTMTDSKALMTAPAAIDSITRSLLCLHPATTTPVRQYNRHSRHRLALTIPVVVGEAYAETVGCVLLLTLHFPKFLLKLLFQIIPLLLEFLLLLLLADILVNPLPCLLRFIQRGVCDVRSFLNPHDQFKSWHDIHCQDHNPCSAH